MENFDYSVARMWLCFYAEAIVGFAMLVGLTVLFMLIGTVLIGGFGDLGGFAWLAVCYGMCLGFDRVLAPVQGAVRSGVLRLFGLGRPA